MNADTFLPLLVELLTKSALVLAAALRHEAGHIAHRDHFTRSLAQSACTFYWPNRLVWFAARRLRAAQEEATDDLVLRAGTAPEEYAAQFFDVARALVARRGLDANAVAMARPSTLERRLLAIVDERRDRRPLSPRAVFGGMIAVALTLALSTAAQLRAEEKKAAAGRAEDTTPAGPQIMVEAKFVELGAAAKSKSKAPVLGSILKSVSAVKGAGGAPGVSAILTESQSAAAMKEINGSKGVDLLSAPRVTTRSGQKALIEIVREFRYPTEYEKDGEAWKPNEFATRNLGVTFGILATAKSDGTLALELTPSVVDLLGFIDRDNGKKYPANAKPNASAPAFDETAGVPAGRRAQPVFSERKITSTVTVRPGQTVVLSGLGERREAADFPVPKPARELAVFVTASLPEGAKAPAPGR